MKSNSKKETYGSRGGCIVSKNILYGHGVRWCVKSEPAAPQDSGWTFMSDADTNEYWQSEENSMVISFDVLAKIEPAVEMIYDYPVGTDVVLEYEDDEPHFYDNITGDRVI